MLDGRVLPPGLTLGTAGANQLPWKWSVGRAGERLGTAVWLPEVRLSAAFEETVATVPAGSAGHLPPGPTDQQMQEVEVFYEPLDRWLGGWVHPDRDGALVVFFRDIHERRTLDEERAAESSLIRAVINALPARIAILDRDGTILTTNAAWAAGTGTAGRPFARRPGENYLASVRAAGDAGDRGALTAAEGMAAVFARREPSFSLDYAATSPAPARADARRHCYPRCYPRPSGEHWPPRSA